MSFSGFGDSFGVPDDSFEDITLDEAMNALKDEILADHYFEANKLEKKENLEGNDIKKFMSPKLFRRVVHDAIMKEVYDKHYVFKKLN